MNGSQQPASPRWGAMTKLVFALTGVAILGILLVRFHTILGPVVIAVVVAYLLQPVAAFIERRTPLSWRITVSLIYLVFILVLIGLATWGGVGLVQQIQNLIVIIQTAVTDLPGIISGMAGKVYTLGPFVFDLSTLDWGSLSQQILAYIQPAIGRLGTLVGTLASGAASTLAWIAFIVIVSYFFLAESGGLRGRIFQVEIPGYAEDIHHLSSRLGRIWNAFLRGQIIIFFSKLISYIVLLSVLGVHYAIGLALIAGFASFLPYVGPAINYLVLGLVAYFQGGNMFGLPPLTYTLIAIVCGILIDQVFDNLVSPRIMAETLKVHPAFVLIAAIVAANLFGILGIIVAAPLLATFRLFGQYSLRKMFDRDPWPVGEDTVPLPPALLPFNNLKTWWRLRRKKKS
jgi:predicted PurR-regulated permease PerM